MTLTKDDIVEIATDLGAEISAEDAGIYRKRYNVAPSDLHWIVEYGADRRVLLPATWGYVASGRPLINVRGEQVGSGAGFREAFRSRRCVVVTDGFFEWTPARAPFWYHRGDGGLLLLAGLHQPADGTAPGTPRPRFTILTTRPNKLVAAVHNRMPVVIEEDRLDDWLTAPPAEIAALIAPAPEHTLIATPVSRRVNSVKHDDPACLAGVAFPEGDSRAAAGTTDDRQRKLF